MAKTKPIEFKVLRKNQYGHRFILEPRERIRFREKCKHNRCQTLCEKGYKCYIDGGVLIGCTPDVSCPRCHAWDRRHGLEKPYTMVENEYPDLRETTITWHPATQSPGKRRVLVAFKVKGLGEGKYLFSPVRFFSPGVTPATCSFETEDGRKKLAVAWAYYDDVVKNIAPWMIERAESAAWAWWPDGEQSSDNRQQKEG